MSARRTLVGEHEKPAKAHQATPDGSLQLGAWFKCIRLVLKGLSQAERLAAGLWPKRIRLKPWMQQWQPQASHIWTLAVAAGLGAAVIRIAGAWIFLGKPKSDAHLR